MRLHLLHNDSRVNGDEVMAVIVREGVVVHLAMRSAGGIVWTRTKRKRAHSRYIHTLVDEQRDGYIASEATIFGWFPIPRIDDGPVESRERRLERRRGFEENELGNGEKNKAELGKEVRKNRTNERNYSNKNELRLSQKEKKMRISLL